MTTGGMEPQFDYVALQKSLAACKDDAELFECIVNAPFTFKVETALLFLGIMVLLLVDKDTGQIHRIALSETEQAKGTTDVSVKRFEDITIPLNEPQNIIAEAIRTGTPQETTDWKYLFVPDLKPVAARINQASGGIAYSAVYPLVGVRDGGALIFSYFQYPEYIGHAQHEFMKRYTRLITESLQG